MGRNVGRKYLPPSLFLLPENARSRTYCAYVEKLPRALKKYPEYVGNTAAEEAAASILQWPPMMTYHLVRAAYNG